MWSDMCEACASESMLQAMEKSWGEKVCKEGQGKRKE